MQVAPPGAKIGTNANCITLAKFGTNSGDFTWWSNFELIQAEQHTIGQIWNQFWWHHLVVKFWTNTSGTTYNWPNASSKRTQVIDSIYTLGPLCLWRCFIVCISDPLMEKFRDWGFSNSFLTTCRKRPPATESIPWSKTACCRSWCVRLHSREAFIEYVDLTLNLS